MEQAGGRRVGRERAGRVPHHVERGRDHRGVANGEGLGDELEAAVRVLAPGVFHRRPRRRGHDARRDRGRRLRRREGVGARADEPVRRHPRERVLAQPGLEPRDRARLLIPKRSPAARPAGRRRSTQTRGDEAAFRKSGLSHLLAVSGTHLVFAVLGVLRGLHAVLRRLERLAVRWEVQRLAAPIGLVLAPLYADFSGGSGSAWRAAFMLLGVLGGRALGRQVFSSRVVALSLGLGWLSDGLVVLNPSFLLSLAATLGLLLAGQSASRQHGASAAELSEPRRVDAGKSSARSMPPPSPASPRVCRACRSCVSQGSAWPAWRRTCWRGRSVKSWRCRCV